MNKKEILDIFRWRKTLVKNSSRIIDAVKSSQEADLSNQGQLNLFDVGMTDMKDDFKLIPFTDPINVIECVNTETELLGCPMLFNPLDDYELHIDLYCTHNATQIFEMVETTKDIIYLDRVVDISYHKSKAGNRYCKLFFSNLGVSNFCYLWGKQYKELIPHVFKDEIYLIKLQYRAATKEFDMTSLVVDFLRNIKDVDIESELERLRKSCIVNELNEPWMLKNIKDEDR